jgi:hypothetical protein
MRLFIGYLPRMRELEKERRRLIPITELVMILSEALRALAPHVAKAGIIWEDGQNYDDWDDVATALHRGIVANAIASAVEGDGYFDFSPYGLSMPTYEKHSILFAREFGPRMPFLRLQSSGHALPFGAATFIELNENGTDSGRRLSCPLAQVEMVALLRSSTGEREITAGIG